MPIKFDTTELVCEVCGCTFLKGRKKSSRFCSIACSNIHRSGTAVRGVCRVCDRKLSTFHIFCGEECRTSFQDMSGVPLSTGTRICRICRVKKKITSFGFNKKHTGGRMYDCRDCHNKRRYSTDDTRLIRHNLSVDQFNKLRTDQGYSCKICKTHEAVRKLVVDHDHACCPTKGKSCGKCVRGLLCDKCNRGLGHFEDNLELLKEAILYLSTTRTM